MCHWHFSAKKLQGHHGLASAIPAAHGVSDGATGNFGYARGMPEGQGKILIAAERRAL
jgi:hypothetical protein